MARWLMIAGLALLLHWFGRLPGDIRLESPRGRVFIPLTSMLLVSIVLTLLINLFRR